MILSAMSFLITLSVDVVINYIKNQKLHHAIKTFENEFRAFLKENNIINDFFVNFKATRWQPGLCAPCGCILKQASD